jgi:hypothetical protein
MVDPDSRIHCGGPLHRSWVSMVGLYSRIHCAGRHCGDLHRSSVSTVGPDTRIHCDGRHHGDLHRSWVLMADNRRVLDSCQRTAFGEVARSGRSVAPQHSLAYEDSWVGNGRFPQIHNDRSTIRGVQTNRASNDARTPNRLHHSKTTKQVAVG